MNLLNILGTINGIVGFITLIFGGLGRYDTDFKYYTLILSICLLITVGSCGGFLYLSHGSQESYINTLQFYNQPLKAFTTKSYHYTNNDNVEWRNGFGLFGFTAPNYVVRTISTDNIPEYMFYIKDNLGYRLNIIDARNIEIKDGNKNEAFGEYIRQQTIHKEWNSNYNSDIKLDTSYSNYELKLLVIPAGTLVSRFDTLNLSNLNLSQ